MDHPPKIPIESLILRHRYRHRRHHHFRRSCMGSSSSTSSSLRPPLFSFSFTIFFFLFLSPAFAGPVSVSSIPINFTASNLQYVDHSGAFLASENGSFQARITNSKPESRSFYFVIIHVISNTIIWSANRNHPISDSSQLRLTAEGLTLFNDTRHPIWSTNLNRPSVSSMQLLESGNLLLIDDRQNVLWQSFDSPTDLLVAEQKLRVGKWLAASKSDGELSEGSYRLLIGVDDAMLQWNGMNYWKLSMDDNAFRDASFPVEFLKTNISGVFLMGGNGEEVVIKRLITNTNNSSDFVYVKLDYTGVISVVVYSSSSRTSKHVFEGPDDKCQIPMICSKLSVCSNGGSCSCASGFHNDANGNCVPTDTSLLLPDSCNNRSSSAETEFKYFTLRNDLDYFSNDFSEPVIHGVNVSLCKNLCSRNCSCLGVFFTQSSGSCYMIRNYLGSMKLGSRNRIGYVKMVEVGGENSDMNQDSDFPTVAVVLLPLMGVVVITIVAVVYVRRRQRRMNSEKRARSKLGYSYSSADEEEDFVSIPGLPVRLDYKELAEATEDFKTQIGSGGFGTVYKGTLRDGSEVAVKKITCLGAQGKREFLTEIAVIGKIHHVNLVKLKGFCAHGGQRFLVYEFMKRGSLDRTLFQGESVLDWKERCAIALGAARGLAYLHCGCDRKIIHCDVKPENILLHEKSQVKISDFGLSKLLGPEQSGHFTTMRGTRGYLAPEWLTSSAISEKTDVYSYGMVLLEIIRGKKNSSPQTRSNTSGTGENALSSPSSGESGHRLIYFPLFALEMHEERRYDELVDPGLVGRVPSHDVEKMVRVALCCVHEDPSLRPTMTNVVGMLEGVVPLGEPRLESLNFLRFYGRRFTEVSTISENSEPNEFMLYRQATANTSSTASYNSFSYISSQQVSGPR